MADVSVTTTFTNGTTAQAAQVNTNFTDITSWINTNAIRKDASVAFTSIPSGPASDPTTANQFTRKSYVDALVDARIPATMTAFTSTLRDGVNGTVTTLSQVSRYVKYGPLVYFQIYIAVGAGTYTGGFLTVSPPAAAPPGVSDVSLFGGVQYVHGTTHYVGSMQVISATQLKSDFSSLVAMPAPTNGDTVSVSGTYIAG